jgi:hypothetical protein
VGSPRFLTPTLQFIKRVLCTSEYTLNNDDCAQKSIQINPPLFKEYGITEVPTIIVQGNKNTYKFTGAMPVSYVLDKIPAEEYSK